MSSVLWGEGDRTWGLIARMMALGLLECRLSDLRLCACCSALRLIFCYEKSVNCQKKEQNQEMDTR